MSIVKDPYYIFIAVKNFITAINAIFLFMASVWLTRFYSHKSVILSLIFLLSTYFMIDIGNNIRVDIFSFWLCLISVLFLLENKFTLAGIALGVAFCLVQKAAWYLFATDAALIASWCVFERSRYQLHNIFKFNFSFLSVLVIYVATWAMIAGVQPVVDSFIIDALKVYDMDIYIADSFVNIRVIMSNDPIYVTLWILALFNIVVIADPNKYKKHFFVLIYATTLMLLVTNYKQVFGYSIIAVIPALLLLYTDFFDWLADLKTHSPKLLVKPNEYILIASICALTYGTIAVSFIFLSYTYMLIWLFTAMVSLYIYNYKSYYSRFFHRAFYFLLIATMCASFYGKMLLAKDDNNYIYQKEVINLVNNLTQDGSTYVAGVDIVYHKKQPISGNSTLFQNKLYLLNRDDKNRKSMLAALELDPNLTLQDTINLIDQSPVKLIVHTFYFSDMPLLEKYLFDHFEHLWGSVYIYSPQFVVGQHAATLKFAGNYLVESTKAITINGKLINPGSTVAMTKQFNYIANTNFRLKLIPNEINVADLPIKLSADIPPRLFLECAHIYVNGRKRCVYFM